MRIAIIGGGWVGCHLAYKLKQTHDIKIFDKNELLFQETSYKNQNRLHLGFHYARNYKTREMCKTTFERFLNDYGFLTKKIDRNLYCIPNSSSIIDYETYLQIFQNFDYDLFENSFKDIEGCINTNEMYIDFLKASEFFNKELLENFTQKNLNKKDIHNLLKTHDLVINATNNHINAVENKDFFYELTLSLIYKKKNDVFFDAVTLVDGDLFSIYPYQNDLYTVTDVEHTPIKKFKRVSSIKKFLEEKVTDKLINDKKNLIESKIKKYYPKFNDDFEYDSFFTSTKSKVKMQSDGRYPIINLKNNLVTCFTGKIQGIYFIEDHIQKIISKKKILKDKT